MSLWTLRGRLDGSRESAVLVDSVTERPLPVLFSSGIAADGFAQWMTEQGNMDPRELSPSDLASIVREYETKPYCYHCDLRESKAREIKNEKTFGWPCCAECWPTEPCATCDGKGGTRSKECGCPVGCSHGTQWFPCDDCKGEGAVAA